MCSASLSQRGAPWLILNVNSAQTAMNNSNIIPLYRTPGSAISGDIILKLDKPEAIQAVKVSIRGLSSFTNGVSGEGERSPALYNKYTFMDIAETLWSSTEGIPKFAEPPPYGYPKDGKLQGKFRFHFTLRLPQTVALGSSIQNERRPTCALPASWSSKRSSAVIDYAICVAVIRGALKANTTLSMTFCYSPRSQPGPPSVLRQQAYAAGTLAPDPLGDPAGWYPVSPPTKVKGKLSSRRPVDFVCSLSLANPLSYSRGRYIPLSLAVHCADRSVLDLLATPQTVSVVLLQCIKVGRNAHLERQRFFRDAHVSPIARAVWWTSPSSVGDWHDSRTLMGEIALPAKMPATTVSPRVVIQYDVVMFPFDVAGFTASDLHSFVVDQPVQITTHDADGPSSRSQAPPGYVNPGKDFNDRLQLIKDAVSIFR